MEKHNQNSETFRMIWVFMLISIVLVIAIVCYVVSNIFSQLIAFIFCLPFVILALSIPVIDMSINKCAKAYYLNSNDPVIQIRPEGLSINCPHRNFNSIPWGYIKEVKPYSFVFKEEMPCLWFLPTLTFLRIVPFNFEEVMKFATADTSRLGQVTLYSAEEARERYIELRKSKLWKFLVSKNTETENVIDIPQDWLPLNANEIAEYINIRKKRFSNSTY